MMRPLAVLATVAQREWRAIYRTSTGGLAAAAFWLVSGAFLLVLVQGYTLHAATVLIDPFGAPTLRIHEHLIAPWLGNTSLVLMLLGPVVAMRSLADEVRLETLPLLLSAPISPWQIILGKFFGIWAFVIAIIAATLWVPLWLTMYATIALQPLAAAYFALVLLSAVVVAMGMFASSLTAQPAAASLLAASLTLMLWILGLVDPDPTSLISRASLSAHVRDLFLGVIRLSDLVYLVGLTTLLLSATTTRLHAWTRR